MPAFVRFWVEEILIKDAQYTLICVHLVLSCLILAIRLFLARRAKTGQFLYLLLPVTLVLSQGHPKDPSSMLDRSSKQQLEIAVN